MKTRKVIWNLVRCALTLALVFAFTTAVVGCAEQTKKAECEKGKAGEKPSPAAKETKPAEKPAATPAPAPAPAKPATPAPAPAPAKPAEKPAEKPAGHP